MQCEGMRLIGVCASGCAAGHAQGDIAALALLASMSTSVGVYSEPFLIIVLGAPSSHCSNQVAAVQHFQH